MNFYVKKSDEAKIEGPFTVEQINQMFKDKRLDLNSTGIADLGQNILQVANSKKNDWINLIYIQGVTGDFPNHIAKRNSLLEKLVIAVFILFLIVIFGYMLLMKLCKGIQ